MIKECIDAWERCRDSDELSTTGFLFDGLITDMAVDAYWANRQVVTV
ncbi:hypothetical protein ACFV0L_10615 [Streptosporangium canum]